MDPLVFASISELWCKTFEARKGSVKPPFWENGAKCSVIVDVSWGISEVLWGGGLESKELPKAWVGGDGGRCEGG